MRRTLSPGSGVDEALLTIARYCYCAAMLRFRSANRSRAGEPGAVFGRNPSAGLIAVSRAATHARRRGGVAPARIERCWRFAGGESEPERTATPPTAGGWQ